MKLPKMIYVCVAGEGDDQYLQANYSKVAAIDGDGPAVVGTYQLLEMNELIKTAQITSKKVR